VWDILCQPEIKHKGRVLITSQAPLHESHQDYNFEGRKLEAIATVDSLNLLLKGKLFSKKPVDEGCPVLDDAALREKCEEVGVEYTAPPSNEKTKDSVKRRRDLSRGLAEISRLELATFLEEELGNLPLSVSMVSQLIRSDPKINSTLDLIEMFKNITMQEAWKQARNRMNDTHLFGLATSVQTMLDRMDSNEDYTLEERREAKALLCALSRLDRTKVPLSLLTGHEMENLVEASEASGLSVFTNVSALTRARSLLCKVGLLHSPSSEHVGVMHQLVQKCVRECLTAKPETAVVLQAVRRMLGERFQHGEHDPPDTWPGLRDLLPSAIAWCDLAHADAGSGVKISVEAAAADVGLLNKAGEALCHVNGDAKSAFEVFTKARSWAETVLPKDHPSIATSMNNLAESLGSLGRHEEALALREEIKKNKRERVTKSVEHMMSQKKVFL
jgi:hypothetical protein